MKTEDPKIHSLRAERQKMSNKRTLSKYTTTQRLSRLEERQELLASLLHDVSRDLDDLRKILRKFIEAMAADKD